MSEKFDSSAYLKTLPAAVSGVYVMYKADATVLYIGKAKNLKQRLRSYFGKNLAAKTEQLVAQIADIKCTITHNETEAFLLEYQLINQYKPKYNIVFRDDKSYTYITLLQASTKVLFPSLSSARLASSKRRLKTKTYYGPFVSAAAVKQVLRLLYELFQLRNCDEAYFKNRTRPCLRHQIGLCSAPCVGLISAAAYQSQVAAAKTVLTGGIESLLLELQQRMQTAAQNQDYAVAAKLRDQLHGLQALFADPQSIITSADAIMANANPVVAAPNEVMPELTSHSLILVIAYAETAACLGLQALKVYGGEVIDSRLVALQNYWALAEPAEVALSLLFDYCSQALGQQLLWQPVKQVVLVLPEQLLKLASEAFARALGQQLCLKQFLPAPDCVQVRGYWPTGLGLKWQQLAQQSVKLAVQQEEVKQTELLALVQLFTNPSVGFIKSNNTKPAIKPILGEAIKPDELLIAAFDVSHLAGQAVVTARVVFNAWGPVPAQNAYWYLPAAGADDYANLAFGVEQSLLTMTGSNRHILLIDGGIGQLRAVYAKVGAIITEHGLIVIAMAKGRERKAGAERYWRALDAKAEQVLEITEQIRIRPRLQLYLQRVRDAVHSYALGLHTSIRRRNSKPEIFGSS